MSTSLYQTVKFYLKSVVFGALVIGCALYGVVASIALRLVGKVDYAQYTVARAFLHSARLFLGINIKVKNAHYLKDLPAVVVSNHQSALDIQVLGKIFQPGYTVTSKKSLAYVPFLGWFMALSGTFFLDRAKSSKAKKVLEGALQILKLQKRALFMFPEGTRSGLETLNMLPFKKGAFHLAKQAGIPIIPVVVSNTSTIFNSKRKIFNTGEIHLEVLPPVPTKDLETSEDVTKCCEKVRSDMIKTLQRVGYSYAPGVKPNEDFQPPQEDVETDTEVEVISEDTPLISSD
ncbi:SLC1 [Candida theae]|uniref:1-acyl-sn-glycerol-3-phosphate acyltransferase n=1 Tax=Candida theae TaxID=1198502 RepID=A0AAD5FYL2_9ASCO|nr:SLC1 [Candida theae]KAI5958348.1 SLC1 [Candida theae]